MEKHILFRKNYTKILVGGRGPKIAKKFKFWIFWVIFEVFRGLNPPQLVPFKKNVTVNVHTSILISKF